MATSIIPPKEQGHEFAAIDGMMSSLAAVAENYDFGVVGNSEGRRLPFVEVYDKSMESMESSGNRSSLFLGETAYFNPDIAHASGDVVIATVPGCAKPLMREYRQTAVGVDGDVSFDLVALNPDFDSVKDAHLCGAIIIAPVIGVCRSF